MTGLAREVRWMFGAAAVLALAATGAPRPAWSQGQAGLPPVIRACVAEADEGRRVDCYDREVARLIMPPERNAAGSSAGTPALPAVFRACVADADANRRRDCYDRETARLIMPPERPATAAMAAPPAADSPARPAPPPPAPAPASTPTHLAAHVTRVEAGADRILVQLDNGQTWEQTVPGSSDLSLKNGAAVRIDRQMGSWWLTDSYGGTLQVRLIR